MSKKIILLFIVIFFSSFHVAYASLTINEIMYDLSGADSTSGKSREWIEIYNPDTSDVAIDASSWRIYDGGANRTINGQVNFTIPSHAYIIFAGDKDTFLVDNPGFSGTVYDTGITSLNNTGATLKILDQDGNIVDSVTYASTQGGAGDGNSLQKISGSWLGATPTLGVTNEPASSSPPLSSPPASTNSNPIPSGGIVHEDSSSGTLNNNAEPKKIKTKIISNTLAFAGAPQSFEAITSGYNGETLHNGKYFWNFGDGDFRDTTLTNIKEKFTHTYFYPGEYIVSLDYYMNNYSDTSETSEKINIKVVRADVVISSVGNDKDFFIELTNNASYEVDISGWVLSGDTLSFVFPKNTILGSKKKITVSSKITNFSISEKDNLRLLNSERDVIFDYSASLVPIVSPKVVVQKVEKISENAISKKPEPAKNIPLENLPALAVQSDVAENNSGNTYIPMLISAILIGGSTGAVYFIRRRGVFPKIGDEFKILDE